MPSCRNISPANQAAGETSNKNKDFKLASELAVVMHASASATSGTVVHQDAPSVAYVDVWKIVELTISRLADGLIDSPNITNAAANDKKLVINRNVSLTDQAPQCSRAQNQDMILAQTCNTVDFGGSEAKSQSPGIRNDNSQPMCKENKAPPSPEPDVDCSVEFADWKGSGNPSRPKCGPPPRDVDPSGQEDPSASDISTDRSRGICPGMGAWDSK